MQRQQFCSRGTWATWLKVGLCGMAVLSVSLAAMANDVAEPQGAPEATTAESVGYGLQPGDIILISIWGEEGLDRPVLVGPDGRISFPLVGNLQAGGRTVEELTGIIAKRVSRYVPNPLVTVSLQDIPGNRIYILGRVNKPGDFVIGRDVQVMQALAMAGGLTAFADRKSINVLRTVDGKQLQIPFNYKEVERGKNLQQNIPLQAGDVIVVP
ncbi:MULTISPECIES: polysaccharide biosynthesis/export family protein [Thiorhodovibrio]|uniref:polysaccharide biosynthesis/export family protein n=1 Tax=Thiorhodovibrio TaxID=61593 RepID=UPI0019126332|nr:MULTISPECIES: polysaccharide biosynthesis/export family protein [Thiorhodovibrio]MBK5970785.1 sugar transporter [Thiorhodovibrio winogradskyi]WPL10824.1 Polysialic acid transport protein KpsD precursor [Thiorhodovibrio litoralis]